MSGRRAAILRVIASSPTTVDPVFDAILDSALSLCASPVGNLLLYDGEAFRLVAHRGVPGAVVEAWQRPQRHGPHNGSTRAVTERRPVQIVDMMADPAYGERDAIRVKAVELLGSRTALFVPMLKDGTPIGVLVIWRREVRAFSESQIQLLSTFADQAVIALENVRLFTELEARNRELTESLEQQTATAEILRVISSSPTDLQPVMDTVAENAARVCSATDSSIFRVDGDGLRLVTRHGELPRLLMIGDHVPITPDSVVGRAAAERRTIHVEDLHALPETEFPETRARQRRSSLTGSRTYLATPLLREGVAVGVILIRRWEARPFSPRQIALLETFAAQAVIAIENVRLFKELEARNRELTEALEQQTATAEILRVISSSPTDLQPVMEVVVGSAARLCGATDATILRLEGDVLQLVAHHGPARTTRRIGERIPVTRTTVYGRAVVDRQTIHIEDLAEAVETEFPELRERQRLTGIRTFLATPLLREGVPIGVIAMRRTEVRAFSDTQIALLKSFADQAVIAIENVRLFTELEARNRELTESLEQQTATAEILRVISVLRPTSNRSWTWWPRTPRGSAAPRIRSSSALRGTSSEWWQGRVRCAAPCASGTAGLSRATR